MTEINMPTPEQAFEMYKDLVEGFDEAIPMLLVGMEVDEGPGLLPVALTGQDDTRDQVARTLNLMVGMYGPLKFAIFSGESYYKEYPKKEEADDVQHGDLTSMAKTGDPQVKEAVSITAVGKDDAYMVFRPFERKQVGDDEYEVTWGEMNIARAREFDGHIPDLLLQAVR